MLGLGQLVARAGLRHRHRSAPALTGGKQVGVGAEAVAGGETGDLATRGAAPAEEDLDGAGMLAVLDQGRQLHGVGADGQGDHVIAGDAAGLGVARREGGVAVPAHLADRIRRLLQPGVVELAAVADRARGAAHQAQPAERSGRRRADGGLGRAGGWRYARHLDEAARQHGAPEGLAAGRGLGRAVHGAAPVGLHEAAPRQHAALGGRPQLLAADHADQRLGRHRAAFGAQGRSVEAGGEHEGGEALFGGAAVPQRMDHRLLQFDQAGRAGGIAPSFRDRADLARATAPGRWSRRGSDSARPAGGPCPGPGRRRAGRRRGWRRRRRSRCPTAGSAHDRGRCGWRAAARRPPRRLRRRAGGSAR